LYTIWKWQTKQCGK